MLKTTASFIDLIQCLFQPCEPHQSGGRTRKVLGVGGGGLGGIDNQQRVLGQTWSKIKTAASTLKEKVLEIRFKMHALIMRDIKGNIN